MNLVSMDLVRASLAAVGLGGDGFCSSRGDGTSQVNLRNRNIACGTWRNGHRDYLPTSSMRSASPSVSHASELFCLLGLYCNDGMETPAEFQT